MLGGSVFRYASAIEVLPGILLALVAANLSLNIVALFLGLNNALTVDFYDQANKMPVTQAQFNGQDIVTKTCNHWDTVGGAALGALTNPIGIVAGAILGESLGCNVNPYVHNWQQILQSTTSPPNITGGASVTGFMFMFQSLSNLLQFITSILALMLMGQMVLRLFFIDLFIVTAPLGIGCWALPGRSGQSLTRLWLQGFFSTLFVQFLQVAALVVLRILIGAITSALYASFQSGVAGSAVNGDATLLWVIQIAQFWFLLRIPALLGTAPLNMLVNFGQTMAQTAQTAVAITAAELQFATSVGMSVVGSGVAAAAIAR